MAIEVHLTPSGHARVSPRGWRQLPSGKWVTFEPLIDAGNAPHFAHLHRKALREAAARIGARMLAPSTVIELNRHGRRLKPVTLTPDSKMSSKARCDEHDTKVRAQIEAAPDDDRPVSGGGKPYIDDTEIAPRQATIFGWGTMPDSSSLAPDAYDEWLQPLQNAHPNDLHSDYSSIHQLEADSDLGLEDKMPDTDPAPGTGAIGELVGSIVQTARDAAAAISAIVDAPPFSFAVLEAAQASLTAGVREQGGRNRGPEVDAWLRTMGVQPPANWCAVSIAKWLRDAVAATGLKSPIAGSPGAKATMGQLQAAKRWHAGAKAARAAFRPGCVVVWHREGPGGWEGHIGIGESADDDPVFTTIEGNSGPAGDRVARMKRRWDDPLLLGIGLLDDVAQRDVKPENDALFIADQLTVATPAAVFEALRKAWPAVIGGEPKRESLLVLLAQWGIENADGASLHSWNLGNVKRVQGKTWTMRKGVWEMIDGKRETFEPPHPQTHFRAFASLEEGAVEYLRILSTRFAKSWPAVLSGDPGAFSRSLKLQRYYSADESAYTAALVARFAQFARAIPGSPSPYDPPAPVNLDTRLGQTVALMSLGYAANVDFAGAVKSFQRASIIPLVADGLWGPRTRAAVLAALKARDG